MKPQIPGFSVEGGGCGGPKKGEGAHPSTLGQTKGAPPVLCSPRRICKSSAFRYRSMKLCTDDLYGKYFKIFLRDNFYIIYIYTYLRIYLCTGKGTVPPNNKNLYYSLDRDENLRTYVKSKTKWGNSLEIFSIFFIANELFTENVKKWGPR